MIDLKNITKVYKMGNLEVGALRNIDLVIGEGEMVSIMGPSGSGKSTLMNILGCLDVATSGRYVLDGEDVQGLGEDQLAEVRNRKIGFVFQTYNLLPRLTALGNVELPLLYGGRRRVRRTAYEVLEKVGLGDRVDHRPVELSGGQQQRVGIARALVKRPSIVLADEPTGNLDTKSSGEIMTILQRLNRQDGNTVIIVTHEPEIVAYTNRAVTIRDGRIVSDETVANPVTAGEQSFQQMEVAA